MNELTIHGGNAANLTMSSREIAELTGSTHDNVLKTVRSLVERGVVSGNEAPYVHPQNGQTYAEFKLSYRDTMVVVSGYSVELRAKIIDRWQELEARPVPLNPANLSRLQLIEIAMQAEQERQSHHQAHEWAPVNHQRGTACGCRTWRGAWPRAARQPMSSWPSSRRHPVIA